MAPAAEEVEEASEAAAEEVLEAAARSTTPETLETVLDNNLVPGRESCAPIRSEPTVHHRVIIIKHDSSFKKTNSIIYPLFYQVRAVEPAA